MKIWSKIHLISLSASPSHNQNHKNNLVHLFKCATDLVFISFSFKKPQDRNFVYFKFWPEYFLWITGFNNSCEMCVFFGSLSQSFFDDERTNHVESWLSSLSLKKHVTLLCDDDPLSYGFARQSVTNLKFISLIATLTLFFMLESWLPKWP